MIVKAKIVSQNTKHTFVNVFIKSGPDSTAQLVGKLVLNTDTMREEMQAIFSTDVVIERN
jgi:hypothetical protein